MLEMKALKAARTAGIDMHAGLMSETLLTITTTSNRLLACQFLPTIGFGFPYCYSARR
jgi:hypothetical protein